jgi:signal transduction histidine kinase
VGERTSQCAAELVLDLDRRYVEVLGLLDGPTATQRLIEDVPDAAGVDAAWVGWPSDSDHVVLRHGVRLTSDAVNGLVVPRGIGLGGQVLALKRPMWVRNYITAPNITHDFVTQADTEGVLAMVAVPIQHDGKVLGLLYGANRYESDFGDRAVQTLDRVAARAAAATVVAERAKHAAEIAAHEERRRVALELHDTVGAMLYTIGVGIHRLGAELADSVPNLRRRLQSLEEQATEAAAALRGSLRALNSPPEQVALGVAVREDVRAFTDRTGVPARVLTLTDLPVLDERRITMLTEVVREALLNVEKHADARSVVVSVFRFDGGVSLTVSDDGVGLSGGGDSGEGLGLTAIADRVSRLGGRLSIGDNEDGGVSVQVWLPR